MDTTALLRETAKERVCSRPRRSTNPETGELVRARCMSQNEKACQSCARLNRMYSMRLIGSGCNVNETDGITAESLSSFAFYFLTLTAPSFKAMHTAGQCRCGTWHERSAGVVSTPLDFKSYRWRDQVEWNRDASALFTHTVQELQRAIPDLEWTAAREWQRRGAIHFHVIVRVRREIDQAQVYGELVKARTRSLKGAAWGRQFDIKGIGADGISNTVAYMAKIVSYTAKGQIESGGGVERLMMRDRLTRAAQRIKCHKPDCAGMKCGGRAHTNLGYAGHLRTQSQGWSLVGLTKKQLHEQRHAFARQMNESSTWDQSIEFIEATEDVETLHLVDRIHDPEELARKQRYVDASAKRQRDRSARAQEKRGS